MSDSFDTDDDLEDQEGLEITVGTSEKRDMVVIAVTMGEDDEDAIVFSLSCAGARQLAHTVRKVADSLAN